MGQNGNLLDFLVGPRFGGEARDVPHQPKAFAWARVSTDMQQEQGHSIEEQLREMRLFAEKDGIEIIEEFAEAASAFQRDERRHEFHRMIAKAKATPGLSVILVHDLSRFSRDSVMAKSLLRELKQVGIRVVSLNDPVIDPDSVAGVYMEAITLAKNEAYSREVAFHTRKGCRANVQARDPETNWCYKNGGQPLWGYRYERRDRSSQKKDRTITKSIWVLDNTIAAGRPAHEWVRHCFLELAAKGASLDELRDFCNESGIPGRRKPYWSTSTWHALLKPSVLLQYCGYGVWNVHQKNGREKPSSEWVVVENAHEALLTEAEARSIVAGRRNPSTKRKFGDGRSRSSPYLLSGGLFRCGRCGANMTGFHTDSGFYYVCGSQPYRRGLGCGPGVYVRKQDVESEVVNGLNGVLALCTDPKGFTGKVNKELRRIWEDSTGFDPNAEQLSQGRQLISASNQRNGPGF